MKKHLFVALISLGFLCGTISLFTIRYECRGVEFLPIYYASPFVHKSTSLATSLAYDYYWTGLIINWIIWFSVFSLLHKAMSGVLADPSRKMAILAYKISIGMIVFVATLNISVALLTSNDTHFENYIELHKEAHQLGATCEGKWYWIGST